MSRVWNLSNILLDNTPTVRLSHYYLPELPAFICYLWRYRPVTASITISTLTNKHSYIISKCILRILSSLAFLIQKYSDSCLGIRDNKRILSSWRKLLEDVIMKIPIISFHIGKLECVINISKIAFLDCIVWDGCHLGADILKDPVSKAFLKFNWNTKATTDSSRLDPFDKIYIT